MAVARKQNASSDMTEAMAASHPSGAHDPSQHHHDHAHSDGDATSETQDRVRDPVCGMMVDPHTTPHRRQFGGRTYYFCSAGCLATFSGSPEKYLAPSGTKPPDTVPEGTIYTCPMHPQIRQVGPGDCPICGMALEPELATADVRAQSRARRHDAGASGSALVLTLPVLALEMGGHLTNLHMVLGQKLVELAAVRARDAGRAVGRVAVLRARLAIARSRRNLNMFTLIAMGTGVAWLYSVVAVACPASSRRPFAGRTARSRSTSRPPRSSPCWCCSARCWSCARASRHRRHPRAARPRAQDRAAGRDGRQRRGGVARCGRGRRPAARAAGREGAGRRRGRRRPVVGRRVHGHRRIDAGDEGGRRQGDRRHAQHSPAASSCAPRRSAATRCSRRSCRWWRRRSARARRSSGWPTRSRAGSCRW